VALFKTFAALPRIAHSRLSAGRLQDKTAILICCSSVLCEKPELYKFTLSRVSALLRCV
ncbi:unnamed protein product, partial [Linum tenue]